MWLAKAMSIALAINCCIPIFLHYYIFAIIYCYITTTSLLTMTVAMAVAALVMAAALAMPVASYGNGRVWLSASDSGSVGLDGAVSQAPEKVRKARKVRKGLCPRLQTKMIYMRGQFSVLNRR